MYSRWTRYNHASDVPTNANCGCLVAKTGKPCEARPKYFVHGTDRWACGRHLQASLPECSICLCAMAKNEEKRIACGHVFHTQCLSRWEDACPTASTRCPVCRAVYFASGYRPMALPKEVVVTYDDEFDGLDHVRLLTEGVLMELVTYRYITQPTVCEMKRIGGPEWHASFARQFCAPVSHDGSVDWSQMDSTHRTAKLLQSLERVVFES
jgi:hypothetical protein